MKSPIILKTLLSLIFLFIFLNTYAGIDYSKYGDGPDFFFGWETSFKFAIGAIVLFGLLRLITENNKDKNGNVEDGIGCIVIPISIAMIICVICSFYLFIPLLLIYTLTKNNKE